MLNLSTEILAAMNLRGDLVSHPAGGAEVSSCVVAVLGAELGLDAEELVVLGEALGPAGGAGLDLSGAEANGYVSDVGVLGLPRAVRSHDAPTGLLGHLHGRDGLGNGANLVDLEEEASASLLVDGTRDLLNVGDSEVITNNLEVLPVLGGELGPVGPVILVEGILDSDNGEVLGELLVEVAEALSRHLVSVVLEVEVVSVLALDLEFRGGDIEADGALAVVASLRRASEAKSRNRLG